MKPSYKVLLALVMILSACGKSNDSGSGNGGGAAADAKPATLQDNVTLAIDEALAPTPAAKPSLTIDDAINMMLNTNPEIAKAEERANEYSYYTAIAKKKIIPTIEATAGYSYDEQKNGIQHYSVGFNQVVWDGTYGPTVKVNAMRQVAEEHRARAIRRTFMIQTVVKYLNLLRAQGGLVASRAQFEAVTRVYSQVGAAWKLGLASDQLKFEAEAEFKKAELTLRQSEGSTSIACIELLAIIGSPGKRALCSSPAPIDAPDLNIPASENDAVRIALENRPEVAIDLALLESARAGKTLARAEFYPKIMMGVQYGMTDSPYGSNMTIPGVNDGFHNDWAVGLTVKIAIFDGGKKKKAAAAAASKVYQAEDDLESTQSQIATEVLTDLVNLETAKHAISTSQSAENAAANLYRETQASYKLGGASLTDLLTRVAGLTAAKNKTLESQYNYVQTLVNLQTSLGLENHP